MDKAVDDCIAVDCDEIEGSSVKVSNDDGDIINVDRGQVLISDEEGESHDVQREQNKTEKLQKIRENLNKLQEVIGKGNNSEDSAVVLDSPSKLLVTDSEVTSMEINKKSNVLGDDSVNNTNDRSMHKNCQINTSCSSSEKKECKQDNEQVMESPDGEMKSAEPVSTEISSKQSDAMNIVTVKVEPIDDDCVITSQIDPGQYRIKVEPESDVENNISSDSTSSSSSSESEDEAEQAKKPQSRSRHSSTSSLTDKQIKLCKEEIRTKGELFPEDLPPLEDLAITVDESVQLIHIGDVTSVIGVLVVVQSNDNMPPLNEDTILFLEGRASCGKIFEVFGPVALPWYSVRFNSLEDITNKEVSIGTKMYCAPKVDQYTNYVFVEHLKQIKGSDASWEDNNEPPAKFVEYSDDEEEKRAKAKHRNKKQQENADGDLLPGAKNSHKKKFRQSNEVTNEPQQTGNSNFNPGAQRHQGPRKFAPFGGQHNKFQPRGPPNHNNPRFPHQPLHQGNRPRFNASNGPSNVNQGGQTFSGNSGPFNQPPHTNTYSFQPPQGNNSGQLMFNQDLSKPPPNFSFGSNQWSNTNALQKTSNCQPFGASKSNLSFNQNSNASEQAWQGHNHTKQNHAPFQADNSNWQQLATNNQSTDNWQQSVTNQQSSDKWQQPVTNYQSGGNWQAPAGCSDSGDSNQHTQSRSGSNIRNWQTPARSSDNTNWQAPSRSSDNTNWQAASRSSDNTNWQAPSRSSGSDNTSWQEPSRFSSSANTNWQAPSRPSGSDNTNWQAPSGPSSSDNNMWQAPEWSSNPNNTNWQAPKSSNPSNASWQATARSSSSDNTSWQAPAPRNNSNYCVQNDQNSGSYIPYQNSNFSQGPAPTSYDNNQTMINRNTENIICNNSVNQGQTGQNINPGRSVVDNRYIQNIEYNKVRQPTPFQNNRPSFGGGPQFNS
ncbi:H/ACA ribonucleoprotein complex non-core subunit NAF1-like isoform X1 [Mytilus edulis]|uniref:H/ACA ribonucleoprotein complex non-core subunit NAF1-like isoform X1 n=1 Tax=Mytilus edulis TaxID=6550 RepID=UPI0039F0306F